MKLVVVGAGTIGQLRAQSIRLNPATELLGVVDPVPAAAERAVAGSAAKALSDLRTALALPGLDAVIVSSPLPAHEEQVIMALEAGKHVLCEKPLGNTIEGCQRMLAAAAKSGKTLATGFNHRYYPSVKYLTDVVRSGRIGTIDHLRIFGAHDGLHNFRTDWQYKSPASGGGAMMDVGIHMTDLAVHLLGDVVEVYGVATNRILQVPGSEDNAVAIFKSPTGIPVTYHAGWTEWKGYRWYVEAYGEKGMVRAYYAPMFNMLITQERPGAPRKKSYQFHLDVMVREKLKGWTSTALQTFHEELHDFLGMLRGERTNLASGFDGFRAVEIANAVYRSTRDGQPVRLTPR
ncbi:MAG: Gfo/Idh/MocA family oxidoreductase [Gemmatimonadales bacterium]